jgi:hypothetical protein
MKLVRIVFTAFFAAISSAALFGCAQAIVGVDPATGITYSDKGAEGDVHAGADQVQETAQRVLQAQGFETSVSKETSGGEKIVDGKNSITGAHVRIIPSASTATHVEVITTEGKLCWNMDYAGLILQDIVQSK